MKKLCIILSAGMLFLTGCSIQLGVDSETYRAAVREHKDLKEQVEELQRERDELEAELEYLEEYGSYPYSSGTALENGMGTEYNDVTYKYYEVQDYLLVEATNTGSTDLGTMYMDVMYYDDDGGLLYSDYDYVDLVAAGGRAVFLLNYPRDYSSNDTLDYELIELQAVSSDDTLYSGNLKDELEIDITDNGDGTILIVFTNNSNETIDTLDAFMLFYSENTVFDYNWHYQDDLDLEPGEEFTILCESVEFDDYELVINGIYY